jgi:hypothetical protein
MREPSSSRASAGNQVSRLRRAAQAPPADPTATRSPVALLARNELGDLAGRRVATAPRAKRSRRRRGPARCGAATLGPAHTTSARPAFVVGRASRRRRHASCSARLQGRARQARPIAVIVPAVGLSRGEQRRSGDGRLGPASLIEQNQPTGVTTRCGLCCSAGLRQRLDDRRVLVHLVQLERAGVRSDRAPACHRNVVLQAWPWRFCPLRRCLFVVGWITILKEGVCSSRCWSMRSQVPMRR